MQRRAAYNSSLVKRLAPLLGLLALATTAAAQTASGPVSFNAGERMEYVVSYGIIPAGTMTLEMAGLETYAGQPAYHATFRAQSNRAVSFLYELTSTEESWFDARELYSLRYRRVSTEKGKTRERDYRFDQERHLRIEAGGEVKPTSPRAVDQLAVLYYLRALPLAPGKSFILRNQADPDNNPLKLRVLKQERIKVPGGTFDTYVLDLDVKTDSGVFKKGGENRVWVTRDDRHVPVRIASKIGLGSFQAELVDYVSGRPVDFAR